MTREYYLEPKYDSRKSFYGKAVVVEDLESNTISLYSYNTKVCEIVMTKPDDFEVVIFNVPRVFSKTTLRHIKEFLKQNGLEATSKDQIQRDYIIKEV